MFHISNSKNLLLKKDPQNNKFGYGNNLENETDIGHSKNPFDLSTTHAIGDSATKNKKSESLFKKIDTYKPSGTIYNELILKKSDN